LNGPVYMPPSELAELRRRGLESIATVIAAARAAARSTIGPATGAIVLLLRFLKVAPVALPASGAAARRRATVVARVVVTRAPTATSTPVNATATCAAILSMRGRSSLHRCLPLVRIGVEGPGCR